MLLTLCPTKMESKLALALWLFPYISRTGGIPEAENMLVAERIHRNLEEQLNNFLRFTIKKPQICSLIEVDGVVHEFTKSDL